MTELTITRPDDWHVHLRDGDMLGETVPATARCFRRAIVMPNLVPPVATATTETLPPVPEKGAVYCSKEELAGCAALALGTPTRFGNAAVYAAACAIAARQLPVRLTVLTPLVEAQIPDTAKKDGMTEEEAERLGGRNIILQALGVEETVSVDVRLILATNEDLARRVEAVAPWVLFLASRVAVTVAFYGYARQGATVIPAVAVLYQAIMSVAWRRGRILTFLDDDFPGFDAAHRNRRSHQLQRFLAQSAKEPDVGQVFRRQLRP